MHKDIFVRLRNLFVTACTILLMPAFAAAALPGTWGGGAGVIFSPNPYRDTKVNTLAIPIITYNDKRLLSVRCIRYLRILREF